MRRGSRHPAASLAEEMGRLEEVVGLAGDDISSSTREDALDLCARSRQRAGLDPDTAVVALVGATGSGKSSLFNAIVGRDLAETGVVRPTTTEPLAAVPPGGGPAELLDWIGVRRRVVVPRGTGLGEGVALVDLPDIDSINRSNREIAERLAQRADMFIWVLDPQKYADDVIHTRYIRPAGGYEGASLFVLNQADLLSPEDRRWVVADCERLLRDDAVKDPALLACSAVSGEGVEELRARIEAVAKRARGQAARLRADISTTRQRLRAEIGVGEEDPPAVSSIRDELVEAAATAAGVPIVVESVDKAYRHRARKATGWLPLRWVHSLRADPLNRLHLGERSSGESSTSLPPASAGQRSHLAISARAQVEELARGRPRPWARRLIEIRQESAATLSGALDEAVARTELGVERRPRWWSVSNAVQWLGWIVAAIGALWIVAIQGAQALLLLSWEAPVWGALPAPTWLIIAGLVVTLVAVGASRAAIALAAGRHARRARANLEAAVAEVVDAQLIAPLQAEDARQRAIAEALR